MPQPRSLPPGLWIILLFLLTVLILKLEGRVWWCACRQPTPYSTNVNSSHNSQHLFDAYSFSHLLHGILFFWGLRLILPKRITFGWRVLIALAIEAGWEILENSPIIINRYRSATASLGYSGDSVVNATGDILSCASGFYLAFKLGWKWALGILIAVELIMLAMIRDNLTLNIIMLIYPIDAIKRWQMGG